MLWAGSNWLEDGKFPNLPKLIRSDRRTRGPTKKKKKREKKSCMIQKYICRHSTGDPLNHSPAKFWLSSLHMVKHCSLSFVRVSMNFDYALVSVHALLPYQADLLSAAELQNHEMKLAYEMMVLSLTGLLLTGRPPGECGIFACMVVCSHR